MVPGSPGGTRASPSGKPPPGRSSAWIYKTPAPRPPGRTRRTRLPHRVGQHPPVPFILDMTCTPKWSSTPGGTIPVLTPAPVPPRGLGPRRESPYDGNPPVPGYNPGSFAGGLRATSTSNPAVPNLQSERSPASGRNFDGLIDEFVPWYNRPLDGRRIFKYLIPAITVRKARRPRKKPVRV